MRALLMVPIPPSRACHRRQAERVCWAVLGTVLLIACPESTAPDLPEIAASSKYIDYRPRADTTAICMDDALAREDRFIENVADFLDIAPPHGRINFVWDPSQSIFDPDTWACNKKEGTPHARNCYKYVSGDDYGIITSSGFVQYHELVHAVELPSLGYGNSILMEGLADYLGTKNTSDAIVSDFPTAFKTMLASDDPVDYAVAMHFVASIIDRFGVEKYKTLRRTLPADATAERFSSDFQSIFGIPLDAALSDMTEPIQGLQPREGCGDDAPDTIPWTTPERIETTLHRKCGDRYFIGGGFADGRPGFGAYLTVDIPQAGTYELTVTDPNKTLEVSGSLDGCLGNPGIVSIRGLTGSKELAAGRYVLSLLFPVSTVPEGTASIRLELVP